MITLDTGTEDLRAEIDGGVAVITMNRPDRRNAFSQAMLSAMAAVLAQVEADDAVGCVVLTGAGGAFCAGGDVKSMAASPARLLLAAGPRTWPRGRQRGRRLCRDVRCGYSEAANGGPGGSPHQLCKNVAADGHQPRAGTSRRPGGRSRLGPQAPVVPLPVPDRPPTQAGRAIGALRPRRSPSRGRS